MEPAKKKSVIAAIKLLAQQMGRKSAAPAPPLADVVADSQGAGSDASAETPAATKTLHSPFVPTPEYVIGAFLSRVRFVCIKFQLAVEFNFAVRSDSASFDSSLCRGMPLLCCHALSFRPQTRF